MTTPRLADRTSRISSSPTMKVTATVDRLRREGVEVIDFGAGEPDFPHAGRRSSAAAHEAIDANFTKYTPVAGIAELKRAICDRYRADYGVEYQESEVIVSAGGKQALFNTALALFNAGRRGDHARAVLADADRAGEAGRGDAGARARRTPEDGFAIRCRRRSSTRSRRARAASSSTRRAIRPAR